jgi:hypothetical protein
VTGAAKAGDVAIDRDVVGRVREHEVRVPAVQQRPEGLRIASIAADQAMATEKPDVPGPGDGRTQLGRAWALVLCLACGPRANSRLPPRSAHIPGDIPDLQSLHLEVMDHSLGTLVPSKVAFIPHETVRAFIRAHPRIGDAFWRDTLIEAAVFREWMAGIGRREAYGRIAHLFCELVARLEAVGLANGGAYPMPITQSEIGDALGLSTVHVNRTMQDLRANGLVSARNGSLIVRDWEALKQAGGFDPTYLHMKKQVAA